VRFHVNSKSVNAVAFHYCYTFYHSKYFVDFVVSEFILNHKHPWALQNKPRSSLDITPPPLQNFPVWAVGDLTSTALHFLFWSTRKFVLQT